MTTYAPAGPRHTPRSVYRSVAFAEVLTWTGLLAAMVLKYGFDLAVAVLIAGSIHGLVFLTYAVTAVLIGVHQHWSLGRMAFAVLTAFVPYATIPFDRHLERAGLLTGGWRRTASADPRDHTRRSRVLRWFLVRPAVLVTTLAAGIVLVMVALLLIGPPGGWN